MFRFGKDSLEDLIKGLYKKYYGEEMTDPDITGWKQWAEENRGYSESWEDFKPRFTQNFKQAVIDDVTQRGLDELGNYPGATSSEFLASLQTLVQSGVNPLQAQRQVLKELETKYLKPGYDAKAESERIKGLTETALQPENIQKYTKLIREMYDPAFQKQAKNIAEQYAGMGRSYQGDAYNRAMARLAGDYQSKNFQDALNLIQQDVQNRLSGSGTALDWTRLGTGTQLAGEQQSHQTLMSMIGRGWEGEDYTQQADLAKELAKIQASSRMPDWAYWVDAISKIV